MDVAISFAAISRTSSSGCSRSLTSASDDNCYGSGARGASTSTSTSTEENVSAIYEIFLKEGPPTAGRVDLAILDQLYRSRGGIVTNHIHHIINDPTQG